MGRCSINVVNVQLQLYIYPIRTSEKSHYRSGNIKSPSFRFPFRLLAVEEKKHNLKIQWYETRIL